MKRNTSISLLVIAFALSNLGVMAQDIQRFSTKQLIGTARYVGMGGAMTAIGADPSAAMDNPAGLGLYRRNEITLTLDETIDRTQQLNTTDSYQRTRFAAPNIAAIWAGGTRNKQRGLINSNLMFSFNRLAQFNRDIVTSGSGMGLVPTICIKTNGLAEDYLMNKPWDDPEIGWLSILGYEGYLIDPAAEDQWVPAVDLTNGSLSIAESGNLDQYTFTWAGNISHQWYIGVGVNIPTLSYTKNVSLLETDRVNSAEVKSLYHTTGVGVNATIGLIYRPIQYLRIGASFQTPTYMAISMQTEGDLYATIKGQSYEILTPASGVVSSNMTAPLRSSISLAGQIAEQGLIALQYDYAHANGMSDVHTLRLGLEAHAAYNLYLNAGYVYESSFFTQDPVIEIPYNDMRTDTDFRFANATQYATAGFGYRGPSIVAQLAYQYQWQMLHQYATECQIEPSLLRTATHRIVATVAWRF